MKWTVYALVDPRNPWDYRYIGCTRRTLERRLSAHMTEALTGGSPKSRWIADLILERKKPTIIPLETTDEQYKAEEQWIELAIAYGAHLLNQENVGTLRKRRNKHVISPDYYDPLVDKIYRQMRPWLGLQ